MGSVLRSASRRKERKRIGRPQVIRREDYQDQGMDTRLELILYRTRFLGHKPALRSLG